MEEQKNVELEQAASEKSGNTRVGTPRRTLMLWLFGGSYLLWTGCNLCKNVLEGTDGGGIGFMLAGIAFAVIGAVLVFFGCKGFYNESKRRKEEEAATAAEAEEPEEGIEEVMEEAPSAEQKKKMSISERAGLAKRLEEEDADETEE